MAQLNVHLEDDVFKAAKTLAFKLDIKLTDVVRSFVVGLVDPPSHGPGRRQVELPVDILPKLIGSDSTFTLGDPLPPDAKIVEARVCDVRGLLILLLESESWDKHPIITPIV